MARSSNASRSEQVTVGAMEIKEAEANLFSLYSLIAKRRIRYTPVFAC